MSSNFWEIPGICSEQSLEFLEQFFDPLCIYDKQGKPIYVSSSFLALLHAPIAAVDFFDFFCASPADIVALTGYWRRAIAGETVRFVFQLGNSSEEIECSLQFNSGAKVMFLRIQQTGTEIDLRKLTEEYERSLLGLFDHPSLATALVSADGVVVKCNQRLHDLLGTTESERILIERFVHPEDRLLGIELKKKLLNQEIDSYTIEKRLITRNTDIVWTNISISLIDVSVCTHKHHQYFAVLLEDITENRKIYNALVRTEEKWKAFVLNSLHLFIQMSRTGQIIYASPAVERVLGYKEEELLDRQIADLIHPGDFNELKLALHLWTQEIKSDQPGIECRWRAKSGKWVYLYIQGKRFPFALDIDGIVLSGYNITERKRLEVELNASEEKFNYLASHIPGAMFQSDSTYRMISASPGIEYLTGYPASELINNQVRSYISLVHPEDLEQLKNSIVEGATNARLMVMEYRIIDAKGGIRWVSERRQSVLAPDGKLLRFDGVLMDMSDRKRLEQELAQARVNLQRYERLNQLYAD
jgi:PAS domain S-box-containing protein